MTDVTGNPEEERRVDYYYQPWVTEGVCRCYLTPTLYLAKSYTWFSGTSMERFSKSERNWIQAWGCAILKEMGKQLNVKVSTLSSWDLVGLLFVYILKGGVAPSVIDTIITVFL